MKMLRSFYHFIGGVWCAILLIATTALFVIAGTLLESLSDSHRYAASWTYSSPVFIVLLGLFFVNILVAALRRWPFKTRHTPFLITHLGLLLLLAGAISKQLWGVQGIMSLIEGSGCQNILINDTLAVEVKTPYSRNYLSFIPGAIIDGPNDLKIECLDCRPNSRERMELWVKGSQAHVNGIAPMTLIDWTEEDLGPLPVAAAASIGDQEIWTFQAFRTNALEELAKRAFLQGMVLKAMSADDPVGEVDLSEALQNGFHFEGGRATAALNLDYHAISGFGNPTLTIAVYLAGHLPETIEISLNGADALLNRNISNRLLGSLPIQFELLRQPTVVIVADTFNDTHLWSLDRHGVVNSEIFRPHAMEHLISYADGFGGYSVESHIIPSLSTRARADRKKALETSLIQSLQQGFTHATLLVPPLQLWVDAAKRANVDAASTFVELLSVWDASHRWACPSNAPISKQTAAVIETLNWSSEEDCTGCAWALDAVSLIEERLHAGEPLSTIVNDIPGSSKLSLVNTSGADTLHQLHSELFAIRSQLPKNEIKYGVALFTSYLRAYGLHYSELASSPQEIDPPSIALECPVTRYHVTVPTENKLEDNLPLALIAISDGVTQETVPLTFDRFGSGMRWPALNGRYLLRFQPMTQSIPYRLRLHEARQVSYPNGNQPFSYEGRLTVTDRRDGDTQEVYLSMNKVHETWDGYRFYLANITPNDESSVRQVQIVINHDRYKYWLTYPGGIALCLGILLLFWFRLPHRESS